MSQTRLKNLKENPMKAESKLLIGVGNKISKESKSLKLQNGRRLVDFEDLIYKMSEKDIFIREKDIQDLLKLETEIEMYLYFTFSIMDLYFDDKFVAPFYFLSNICSASRQRMSIGLKSILLKDRFSKIQDGGSKLNIYTRVSKIKKCRLIKIEKDIFRDSMDSTFKRFFKSKYNDSELIKMFGEKMYKKIFCGLS